MTIINTLLCLIGLFSGFFVLLPRVKRSLKLKRWQKSLQLKEHTREFETLFAPVDGFTLSRQARKNQDFTDYIYGEIEFTSWIALLSLTKPQSTDVFYDLGSGVGKAVLALSMVFSVRKAYGIEILNDLHNAACQRKTLLIEHPQYCHLKNQIHFIEGSFLNAYLDDATYLFINSTTLFEPTWSALCSRLDALPVLKTVITTSKPLKSQRWVPVITTQVQMSWGIVDAYIHKPNPLENIE